MLQQYKSSSLQKQDYKSAPITKVYDQIMKSFGKQALRIKFKFSNPSFDDRMVVKPRKILPKIDIQQEKKSCLKFYSKKLVINEQIYINQRKLYDPKQFVQTQFQKLFIPNLKQTSVLSDRNKRIMQLYRRVQRDSQFSPTKIKFTQNIQANNKISHIQMSPINDQRPNKNTFNIYSNEKNMLNMLKQRKDRKKNLELPFMKSQRSKSNIVLNCYSDQTEIENPQVNTLQCKKIQEKNEKQGKRGRTMKKLKYQPNKQAIIKRRFNWKAQPLSINKIDKQQYYKLIRDYLNLPQPTPIQSGFYKAYIGPGNNCNLIKKLLKDRGCWMIVESLQQEPNFVWTQIISEKFNRKLISNNPKKYSNISRKITDLTSQISSFIKLKQNDYILSCKKLLEEKHFVALMKEVKLRFQVGQNISYFSKISQIFKDYLSDFKVYEDMNYQIWADEIKVHNHITNSGSIGDKKSLLRMMQKYCQIFDEKVENYLPNTLHLVNTQNFEQIFQKIPTGPWILKPGEATNRGYGITIHTTKQTLIGQLNKKKKHKGGIKYTNIIQQYIDPLLYHGRKFDIRIWVLWSGRRLWWYRQGYLRTSSKQFTYKNVNKFIHLTNDAIQSQGQDFGKYEPANKLSFNQFQKYLQSQYNYSGFYTEILVQMKKMAVKCFRMGNLFFDKENKAFNFQLFGLDFLIDNKFKPWLIQCNTNPCLEINCSLLARLVPNMLQNVMNLTTDVYFPLPYKKRKIQPATWSHEPFKFQLIYCGVFDQQMQQKLSSTNIKIEYYQQQQTNQQSQQKTYCK